MASFFGAFFLLLATGVPIALALGVGGMIYLFLSGNGAVILALPQRMMAGVDQFILLTIPLFLLAGMLMNVGGITDRIVTFARAMVGHRRGGMSSVTVISSGFFAGISGSATAEASALGSILIPAMQKQGIPPAYAAALVGVSSIMGPIIPPSITMIIYGVAAQQSVPRLFLAGIVPGILIGILVSIYLLVYARITLVPLTDPLRWRTLVSATREAIWALLAPVVILGGIYGGLFTPTEAAGIACIYAIAVSIFIYRAMSWAQLWQTAIDSARITAQILIIVSAAGAYSWVVTTSGFPQSLVDFIANLHVPTWNLLLIINVVLLFVGTVLEPPAAILILTPLLIPLVQQAGIDEIHFGIIFTVNLAVGMFIPPFGLNLFATHALFDIPLGRLYRGVAPFIVIYLIALALITYVPAITLAPLRLWH
jgi:tripartite ATP-independent transporter DctM subunit